MTHGRKKNIDLLISHPENLSSVHNIAEFAQEMKEVAEECMRVLKPGKHCTILMGDIIGCEMEIILQQGI